MNEKILFVGDIVINKKIFHERKHPVNINNVDINKIIISNKDLFEGKGFFEYFIGYIEVSMVLYTIIYKSPSNQWVCQMF